MREGGTVGIKKIEKVKDFCFIAKRTKRHFLSNSVIRPPPFLNTPEMPDVCLSFVLLLPIFIIVVTQKLVLQQS